MYVKNVEPAFCSIFSECSVTFGTRKGTVAAVSYANKILTIRIKPPAIGVGGSTAGLVSYQGVAPPAFLKPIDGACSGGEMLTVKLLGLGVIIQNAADVKVRFGDVEGMVTRVLDSVASSSYSLSTLAVTSPILGTKGIHSGVVAYGEKRVSFSFECFDAPAALALPALATLDGRTTSADKKSVALVLTNFPPLATTADVEVRFGDVVCDAIACRVLSFSKCKPR